MGTSRTIAVVGLRTTPRGAWRTDVASAARFVRSRPDAWLLGMLGAALRGGVVLLTVPILVLPTQVEARMALGANLGSAGLTGGFWYLMAGATALSVMLLVAVAYGIARVELSSYSRLVGDPASAEQRGWRNPEDDGGSSRRMVFLPLLAVQAVGALALLLSALPLAAALRDAAMLELLSPTSTIPLYERVAAHVTREVLVVVLAVVLVEFVAAAASRALLAHGHGFGRRGRGVFGSLGIAVRGVARAAFANPLRSLADALVGWALFVAALAAGTLLVGVAWDAARAVFLSASRSSDAVHFLALLAVAVLLAGCFGAALLALGLVSALRAALTSLSSLR